MKYEVFITYEELGDLYEYAPFDNDSLKSSYRDWIKEIAPSGWTWVKKQEGILFCFRVENEAILFKLRTIRLTIIKSVLS